MTTGLQRRLTTLLLSVPFLLSMWGCGLQTFGSTQFSERTNVSFPDHSPQEVREAARKVLAESDERMRIESGEGYLKAERWWKTLAPVDVSGLDQWHLSFQSRDGVTRVHLKVSTLLMNLYGSMSGPRYQSVSPNGPAVYDLFWNRVRAALGEGEKGMSCDRMRRRVEQGQTFGQLGLLCGEPHRDYLEPPYR